MSVNHILARIESRLEAVERLLTEQADEVLAIDAVCGLTGLSKSAVYQKTCSRNGEAPELPHYKQGKRLYFRRSEIMSWLTRRRVLDRSEIESIAANYCVSGAGRRSS